MAQEEETKDLISFNWEGEGEDFFGIGGTTTEEKVVEPKKKEVVEAAEEAAQTEEEKEDDDFFEVGDAKPKVGDEEEEEAGDVSTADTPDEYWNDIYKDFKQTGLLKHVEIEEGEKLTEERLTELQEEDYEQEVSQRLQDWASEDLDEDAKAFLKFKREGGNTADFLTTYTNTSSIPKGDISDEKYQDKVIRYNLKQEGWDDDEIEDRLEYLTENRRKEKVAVKYDEKNKAVEKTEKDRLQVQANETKRLQKANEENFKNSIKNTLASKKEINGFSINETDKSDILNFLTKKSQKISDEKSITPFQQKLAEVFQDTEKTILLAKLLQSDFDMKDLKRQITTKKTREIKSNIEQRRTLRPSSSGSSLKGSRLADVIFK
jgi:hypothetical protein